MSTPDKLRSKERSVCLVFGLFLLVNIAFLGSVPGLMGDEAHEGLNVYEKWEVTREMREGDAGCRIKCGMTELLKGERSYIGPAIDYLRMPFVWVLGANAWALRLPMMLLNLLGFYLLFDLLRGWLGDKRGLLVTSAVMFSPIMLTYGRLGWAITLLPFFTIFLAWTLFKPDLKWRGVWVGVAAGLGLHTHVLFFPALIASISMFALAHSPAFAKATAGRRGKTIIAWALGIVVFSSIFSSQAYMLLNFSEDQGSPDKVIEAFEQRIQDFGEAVPVYVSGSSYVARYTGVEFAPWVQGVIVLVLLVLVCIALFHEKTKKISWLILLGLALHLILMMLMIDRFTLRYFMTFSLGVWLLAGVGLSVVLSLNQQHPSGVASRHPWGVIAPGGVIALSLSVIWGSLALVPFMQTGGSVNDFSLGNRTNSSADVASHFELMACLEGLGQTVSSENPHVFNRLDFLQHSRDLQVVPEENSDKAELLVHYRREDSPEMLLEDEACPELLHFIVAKQEGND